MFLLCDNLGAKTASKVHVGCFAMDMMRMVIKRRKYEQKDESAVIKGYVIVLTVFYKERYCDGRTGATTG